MLTTIICAECGRKDDGRARGWRGCLVDLDADGGDEILFFCPRCATREFGFDRGARRARSLALSL
jgi:hypothetical protein